MIRRWHRLYIIPQMAVFPKLCPVCLSGNADASVNEGSDKRQTGSYVLAQRLEWWRGVVPYCSECKRKLSRNQVIGVLLGAGCAGLAFLCYPPAELSVVSLCYILFAYPAYAVATTIGKGIVFGPARSHIIRVHVRHGEYFTKLVALNPSSNPADTILIGLTEDALRILKASPRFEATGLAADPPPSPTIEDGSYRFQVSRATAVSAMNCLKARYAELLGPNGNPLEPANLDGPDRQAQLEKVICWMAVKEIQHALDQQVQAG